MPQLATVYHKGRSAVEMCEIWREWACAFPVTHTTSQQTQERPGWGRNQPGRGGPFLGHSRPQFGSSRSRAVARGISSTIEGYLPMKAVAAVLPVLALVAPAGFWSALAGGRSMEKTVPFAPIPECDRGTNT